MIVGQDHTEFGVPGFYRYGDSSAVMIHDYYIPLIALFPLSITPIVVVPPKSIILSQATARKKVQLSGIVSEKISLIIMSGGLTSSTFAGNKFRHQ